MNSTGSWAKYKSFLDDHKEVWITFEMISLISDGSLSAKAPENIGNATIK